MRPITIIQAVGAFLVGRLVILLSASSSAVTPPLLWKEGLTILLASLSIYMGYGAGMAMNDCADVALDARHEVKQTRSMASDAISVKRGWIFCGALSAVSIALAAMTDSMGGSAGISSIANFTTWTTLNLALMAAYALGLQKLFLLKNLLCGFFAISPLVGASLLQGSAAAATAAVASSSSAEMTIKLYQLAAIGFPLQVSREILKDIEDVDVDIGKKSTLPLVIGAKTSKRIAYAIVGAVNAGMILLPHYWNMFASTPPVYALSVAIGTPMCIVASRLELGRGQRLLKKSIYVLLAGMILGLLLQSLN
eukprot:CAMPEP_0183748144 /NCGR_PEP_ID=MMETSP0737-20130205/67622_1 /TAXON_ID=385413 /ORGANISM="Thalassiosira miniscula, Strain CCMP1093" /LENGTH=308 /DNA_ID=CAMNT_0025983863 /DNA_START=907 /DNA_END=1833 /DNA_ORIENTATION=-